MVCWAAEWPVSTYPAEPTAPALACRRTAPTMVQYLTESDAGPADQAHRAAGIRCSPWRTTRMAPACSRAGNATICLTDSRTATADRIREDLTNGSATSRSTSRRPNVCIAKGEDTTTNAVADASRCFKALGVGGNDGGRRARHDRRHRCHAGQ